MHLWNIGPQEPAKRWKLEQISNDVGGEVAEAVEDRIAVLSDRIRKQEIEIATRDAEIAAKDRLLARQVQELQDALQTRCKVPSNVVKAQLAELRAKIEGLERLMSSSRDPPDAPNNTI
ncbi:hypothetical protein B0J17DRAFT_643302 [Rhizoctonia solani]|nr:hypothetical protein B0J17DRAFT_643302 [Rhizoctonia solani]